MTMNGAVLPVLAMFIVAAEEQVNQLHKELTYESKSWLPAFQINGAQPFIMRNCWFFRCMDLAKQCYQEEGCPYLSNQAPMPKTAVPWAQIVKPADKTEIVIWVVLG
jgi:hypothetical protein